jgi:hypothetical protein
VVSADPSLSSSSFGSSGACADEQGNVQPGRAIGLGGRAQDGRGTSAGDEGRTHLDEPRLPRPVGRRRRKVVVVGDGLAGEPVERGADERELFGGHGRSGEGGVDARERERDGCGSAGDDRRAGARISDVLQ